jgi:ribosomal protein S18 acetylase RimI-like enzyme
MREGDTASTPTIAVSRSPGASLRRLGEGDLRRGQRPFLRLLCDALAGSAYARAYGSVAAALQGELDALAALPEATTPLLLWAALEGRVVGLFWGYEVAAAPAVCEELRVRTRRALDTCAARAEGLEAFGLSARARAEPAALRAFAESVARPRPRLFYADWVAVSPAHRGRGVARSLWSRGLATAHASGRFDGYVSRTIRQNRGFLERFYCDEMGGRVYFTWSEGELRRVAFGGRW